MAHRTRCQSCILHSVRSPPPLNTVLFALPNFGGEDGLTTIPITPGVAEIFTSPMVLRIIFSILYQVVENKRQPKGSTSGGLKYGQASEMLFNEALCLLLLALQWRRSHDEAVSSDRSSRDEAMLDADEHQTATRVENMLDLQFSPRKEDLMLNLCRPFVIVCSPADAKGKEREGEPASGFGCETILGFVAELADEGEIQFAEQHHAFLSILDLAQKCDDRGEASRLLHALRYSTSSSSSR